MEKIGCIKIVRWKEKDRKKHYFNGPSQSRREFLLRELNETREEATEKYGKDNQIKGCDRTKIISDTYPSCEIGKYACLSINSHTKEFI